MQEIFQSGTFELPAIRERGLTFKVCFREIHLFKTHFIINWKPGKHQQKKYEKKKVLFYLYNAEAHDLKATGPNPKRKQERANTHQLVQLM